MRVALDATPLSIPTGGVARYTRELSHVLAQRFPEDEFWLLSDQRFSLPCDGPANLRAGRAPRSSIERRWWLWGLEREMSRIGAQIFHGTDFSVPYLPLRPSVMTLHDLSPWMDHAWQEHAVRVRRRTPLLLRLGLATLVVTPSEAVRRQAIERFRLQPDRVAAIPLAASSQFRPVSAPAPAAPYFLFVGTLEPRKNLGRLVEAWRAVRCRRAVDLVVAGRRRGDFDGLADEPGLKLLGAVADEELAPLYSGAAACVYPSLYEGFGLPVLEAMQCGALVIASKDAAITEVAAGAAVQLEAGDTRAWVAALEAALDAPDALRELRRKGPERAAEFSWTRTAERTREVYDEARRRFRR